jgi:hypothetical protein
MPDQEAKEISWHQLDSISYNDTPPTKHPINGSKNNNKDKSKKGRIDKKKSSSSSHKQNPNKSTPSNPWSIEINDNH